jgi:HK97 gp10 family phage protein
MKLTVEIKGLDKLADNIIDEQALSQALGKACALVERAAKEKAPKDTGELRRSITSEIRDNEGVIFTTLEYAPYVEYGTGLFAENGGRKDVPWCYQDDKGEWHTTSGMKPQPFMRPAFDENREKIIEIIKGAIK